MKSLELAVPPPLVMVATALIMWLPAAIAPGLTLPALSVLPIAIIVAMIGVAISMAGIITFKRAHTTPDPRHPQEASMLVTYGIYRLSRNPMYLGIQLVLIAWGVFLGNVLSLLFAFAFGLYIHRFQIRPEERLLREKFGTHFTSYKGKVRAWI